MYLRKPYLPYLWLWFAAASSLMPSTAFTQERFHIAVAANFKGTMEKILQRYQAHGQTIPQVSYGSSGKLYAQIRQGAPFSIFLSADQQKPAQLETANLVVPNSRFTYAIGQLVLWSPLPSVVRGADSLYDHEVSHIALANPRTAPYGRAAKQVLDRQLIKPGFKQKRVIAENVAQAFTFVRSGTVTMGFIALSQWLNLPTEQRGSHWLVPQSMHKPILQDAVLLKQPSLRPNITAFYQFLQSTDVDTIIGTSGYKLEKPVHPALSVARSDS